MTRPWIQTRAGRAVELLDPDLASMGVRDLAHALAHINRFTGHAGVYSVAQHSVLVADALRSEGHDPYVQIAGLLHDAHEAIVGDVSSPMKRAMRLRLAENLLAEGLVEDFSEALDMAARLDPFHALEIKAWRAVADRFGLPYDLPEPVKAADLRALLTEARDLLGPPPRPWGIPAAPYVLPVVPWSPGRALREFLFEASRLGVS